jgi:hypothetical protein
VNSQSKWTSAGGRILTTTEEGLSSRKRGAESLGKPAAETGIFAVNGEYWTLGYGGATFPLKDIKGLSCIQRLLQHPGEEFHALDLLGGADTSITSESERVEKHESSLDIGVTFRRGLTGDAGEMLDAKAKQDYKRKLLQLNEQLEDLRERGNHERTEQIESDIEFLTRELTRAVGRGGRDRRAGSAAERARLNVTRAIKAAIQKISERHAVMGELLERSIKTGSFCSCVPDPRTRVSWQFSLGSPSPQDEAAASELLFSQHESSFLRAFTEGTAFVGREAESSTPRSRSRTGARWRRKDSAYRRRRGRRKNTYRGGGRQKRFTTGNADVGGKLLRSRRSSALHTVC